MTEPGGFPLTDILWLVADDVDIETAVGNGHLHAQVNYWTNGYFLPG